MSRRNDASLLGRENLIDLPRPSHNHEGRVYVTLIRASTDTGSLSVRLSFPSTCLDIYNFNCPRRCNSVRDRRIVKRKSKSDTKSRIYMNTMGYSYINCDDEMIKRYLNIPTRDLLGWARNNLVIHIGVRACEGKRNENFRRV